MADLVVQWRRQSAETGVPWAISFDEPQKINAALYWLRALINPLSEEPYGMSPEMMERIRSGEVTPEMIERMRSRRGGGQGGGARRGTGHQRHVRRPPPGSA